MAIDPGKSANISVNLDIENKEIPSDQLLKALDEAYEKAKASHLAALSADSGGTCSGHSKTSFERSTC